MNQKGVALITAMIFLALLTLIGVWAVTQSTTSIKITASLKRYDLTFNLADGATSMAIGYLKKHTPPSPNWDPTVQGEITSGLPLYIQNTQEITLPSLPVKPKYKPSIEWRGYASNPLPGWMINWQGYSAFHRVHYLAKGKGEIPDVAQTVIRALVVKIIY